MRRRPAPLRTVGDPFRSAAAAVLVLFAVCLLPIHAADWSHASVLDASGRAIGAPPAAPVSSAADDGVCALCLGVSQSRNGALGPLALSPVSIPHASTDFFPAPSEAIPWLVVSSARSRAPPPIA